jgi:hypothetical protein
VFPEGFRALFAPAAALPAWLPTPLLLKPVVEPVVPELPLGLVEVPVPAVAPVVPPPVPPPAPPAPAPPWAKAAALESIKAIANPIAVDFMDCFHRLLAIGDKHLSRFMFQTSGSGCDLSARLRASLAGCHAFVHVTGLRTVAGTLLADLRAFPAEMPVMRSIDQHEMGGCPADLRASHHEAKVGRRNMLSTGLKTVVHGCRKTHLVTTEASLDATGHLFFHGESEKAAPETRERFSGASRGRSTVIGGITGRPTAAMRASFLTLRECSWTDSPM